MQGYIPGSLGSSLSAREQQGRAEQVAASTQATGIPAATSLAGGGMLGDLPV